MQVDYEEQDLSTGLIFPYWITYKVVQSQDDIMAMMDVNEWCGQTFGELGVKWGYERSRNAHAVNGSVKYSFRNPPQIIYSWRFLNKSDAMIFKLKWGGV